MSKLLFGGLAACLLSAAPAMASTSPDWDFGGTFGTLGMGPQLSVRGPHIGAHIDGTFLSLKGHVSSNGTHYRGRFDLRSAGAMIDLYPFGGRFHVSAGARYNGNNGTIEAMPDRVTVIGGMSFTPQQIGTVSGHVDTRKFAPAVTMGYGSKPGKGFNWRVEGGALFQGGVRLSALTSSTGMIPQANLVAERQQLQDDVGKYKVFPIAQLELGWRF